MATLSVVIPARNANEWLMFACRSALEGDEANEVIIVDDGGNDDSLQAVASSDSRVRVLPGPRSGVSAARNVGQEAARSDILAFLDADDMFEEDGLRELVWPIRGGGSSATIACWRDADPDMNPFRTSVTLPREADNLTSLIQRPTVVSAFAARRPWPRWIESLSVWEVSSWQHDVVRDGRAVAVSDRIVTRVRQHFSSSRLSVQERHFDPLVCGRYWLSEKLRLGSSVGVEARGAMERQLTDSIYQLLRQSRVEQAGELWQGIDRRVLRAAARARVGQARWLGGWLGLSAMQAHAAIAIASERLRNSRLPE